MSTYEVEDKAISGSETEVTHDTAEEHIPATKSSVHGRPDPLLQTARYKKQDIVHFAGLVGGRRIKVTGEVFQSRYNRERQYVEHQLKDVLTGTLSQNGTWFRDGDLKLERAAQR